MYKMNGNIFRQYALRSDYYTQDSGHKHREKEGTRD